MLISREGSIENQIRIGVAFTRGPIPVASFGDRSSDCRERTGQRAQGSIDIFVTDQDGQPRDGAAFAFQRIDGDDSTDDSTDADDSADELTDVVDDATDTDTADDTDLPDDGGDSGSGDGGGALDILGLGSDDGLFGATRFSTSSQSGNVDSLAFAQATAGIETYSMAAGTYRVTQIATPDGCPFTAPFNTTIVGGDTVTASVQLNCGGDTDPDGSDNSDDSDGSDSNGDSDGGSDVTGLPSTGNGSVAGMMSNQSLLILLSLVSALVLAAGFGWTMRTNKSE